MNSSHALLTPSEMYRADALAVKAGVASITQIGNAGRVVAGKTACRFGARPLMQKALRPHDRWSCLNS